MANVQSDSRTNQQSVGARAHSGWIIGRLGGFAGGGLRRDRNRQRHWWLVAFAHKPSYAAVPQAGHNYPGHDADADINVVGPMARSARDLDRLMRLLSDRVLPDEPRRTLREFTVGVMLQNPCGGQQDREMTAVLSQAISTLEANGMTVSNAQPAHDLRRAQENYLMLNYAASALVDRGDRPFETEQGTALSHAMWLQLANERQRIRNQWANYFDQVDVLLCPVAASPAPPHQTDVAFADQTIPVNGQIVSTTQQWVWAGMAAGAYLPATIAPVGLSPAGLPIGMQIIAPFGHDHRSIAFAGLVEQSLGGFQPPPIVTSLL